MIAATRLLTIVMTFEINVRGTKAEGLYVRIVLFLFRLKMAAVFGSFMGGIIKPFTDAISSQLLPMFDWMIVLRS